MSWEVPAGGGGALGFTNTGLGYDGTNLLIGDFTNGRIVKTSTAGAYVGEIVLASAPANSVQGVTYDTSDGTYWVSHYGTSSNGTVKHYNSSGTLLDTIACAVATTGPSGCCYDAVNDRVLTIWDDGHMRSYNCATLSATPVENITLDAALGTGSGTGPDGVAMDPSDATYIWVSADSTPAKVHKITRSSGASAASWVAPIAPEGLVWVGSTLHLCCDGGYHASIANGNRVFQFDASGNEIQGSDYLSKIVFVDLATSTTTQIITGVGFRPRAIIALGRATAAAQATANLVAGAADTAFNQWSMTTRWNDADAAAPIVAHQFETTKLITRVLGDGAAYLSAAYLDATHDGFRLSVTNGSAGVHRCAFLCIAGDGVRAKVGTFNINNATGVQAVTGTGFVPKAVLFGTNKSNTTLGRDSTNPARWTFGAMTAAAQWGVDTFVNQSVPQTVYGAAETTDCILRAGSSSTYSIKAAYSSMDADGFSINIGTAAGALVICGYVALGGAIQAKAGTWQQPTATGSQAITGVGFQPDTLILASASSATTGAQAQTRPSYGVARSSTQRAAHGGSALNAANPSSAGGILSEALAITHLTGTVTTVAAADLTSMDADGFTLNWTTADATQRNEYYLAFGSAAAGGAVSKTGADTLAPALTETPTLLSASTLADSLTPALAEAAAVQAALSGADTLTPALTEAATLLVALSGADTLTPALAETAILLGLIDRLDTLTPALSESASLLVAVGASDALTPSLADLATLLVALDATDTLTPALTEALDLLARLDRGDALTPALIETATLLGLIERADTLTPTLAEAAALLAALDATDTLTPNLAEAAAVLVALSATDTLTPALADTAAVLAIIGLAATPALQFVVPAATRGFIIPAPGRAFDIQPHRHAA